MRGVEDGVRNMTIGKQSAGSSHTGKPAHRKAASRKPARGFPTFRDEWQVKPTGHRTATKKRMCDESVRRRSSFVLFL